MVDAIAASPLAFWAIALCIVAADGAVVLQPGDFAFRFRKGLCVNVRAGIPFQLGGKELLNSLPAYPFAPFFISSLNAPRQDRMELRRALVELKRLLRNTKGLAYVNVAALALFCAGPLVSLQHGIAFSIVWVFPGFYLLSGLAVVLLWLRSDAYELRPKQLAKISLLLALCPILVCNIVKTLVTAYSSQLNTIDLVECFVQEKEETLRKIEEHIGATGIAMPELRTDGS